MNDIGYVYMITSPSNRLYVGSTINIRKRCISYRNLHCKSQYKLYNSLNKYGFDNHTFEIILECPIEEMYKYETLVGWYHDVLNSENLNLALPKLGDIYQCISDETREKMIKVQRGRKVKPFTQEHKDNLSKARKLVIRKPMSEETKLKISIAAKERGTMSREVYKKISQAKTGKKRKPFSEKHKYNNGIAHKIPVIQYDLKGNFIKEWDSATDAAREFKANQANITSCCKGRKGCKTTKGFIWKYKNY